MPSARRVSKPVMTRLGSLFRGADQEGVWQGDAPSQGHCSLMVYLTKSSKSAEDPVYASSVAKLQKTRDRNAWETIPWHTSSEQCFGRSPHALGGAGLWLLLGTLCWRDQGEQEGGVTMITTAIRWSG